MLLFPYSYFRDDEHRTALMLAAEEGHTLVMKILLDNHAPVNELDKLKVRSIVCVVSITPIN